MRLIVFGSLILLGTIDEADRRGIALKSLAENEAEAIAQ
jgi:hypothetical protein